RTLVFCACDVLHRHGTDLLHEPLAVRKELLQGVANSFSPPVILNQHFAVDLDSFIRQVRTLELEGVVAKRASSIYQPGKKSDDWQKHHFKQQGKFTIGGYIPG